MMKRNVFIAIALILAFAFSLNAQVTTSGLSGKVTSNGEPIIGATIVALHTPSGSSYGAVTNVDGRYNITGMRVGGPYEVKVSYVGYSEVKMTGIQLQLGEVYPLAVELKEGSEELKELVVTSQRTKFTTEKTGATTNITTEKMASIPTISRSVADIAKMSPYASGMSFGGSDGPSTNFTVDGANFNNNFGLSSNLPGGGSPISIDAIEEMQVVITPYDVRQTNFIGGGINAITKSGTNTLKGSVYNYFTHQNLRGNKIGDYDFGARPDASKTIYGFTVGAPIIKNKLFIFANAEIEKRPGQIVTWKASDTGISDGISLSRTKVSDMERVKNHLINNYGYDPGSFTDFPGDESNMKLLTRLDWNINDKNKLSLRYNYTKNQVWNQTNGNSTDAGLRNSTMNRISQYSMVFANSLYSMDNIVNSVAAELNTRFNNKMSNQFLATYTKIDDVRGSNSDKFPFIDILAGYNATTGYPTIEPYMSAGYELFTWNNGVHNKVYSVIDNFTLYLDKHKLTAGLSYEYQMANNAYMRNGTGYYRYASVDDFINGAKPLDFALTYGYNGEENPAAEVAFHQFGGYIQDEWNVFDNLKLTYGIRLDELKFVDNIITNNAIKALRFGNDSIDTGVWPTAKLLVSPRMGFTWDVLKDQTLKVRGGTGIFTGRLPLVFFTNMPTNAGMVQNNYKATTTYNSNGSIKTQSADLAKFVGGMETDVAKMISMLNLPTTISPQNGVLPSEIAGVNPNFRMPQVWKSSLAVDYQVPVGFPLTVTVEGIYTKNINAVMLKNWSLKAPDANWTKFGGSDDRYIYPTTNNRYWSKNAYVLENTDKGWGAIENITVNASPIKNLDIMAAYTHTASFEVTGMPGSNAASAYGGVVSVNGPQFGELQSSQYVVPDKVIASLSYKLPYLNNMMSTSINLFYTGSATAGYNFMYSNDMNGDGWITDLIYVPSGKGDIKFLTTADEDAFFAFVEQDKYLSKHKGEYVKANEVKAPWVHNFDLRIVQGFNLKVGKVNNTLEISLDFLNFGNLLNNTWGTYKNMSSSNYGKILKYESKDANNVPTFSMVKIKDSAGNMVYPTETFTTNYSYSQTWSLQFGIRYKFN